MLHCPSYWSGYDTGNHQKCFEMRKLVFALLVIISPCIFAHGWITDIAISESVVAQGRVLNLVIRTPCSTPEFISARDLGNGYLEFEIEEGGGPITMCIPHARTYDGSQATLSGLKRDSQYSGEI